LEKRTVVVSAIERVVRVIASPAGYRPCLTIESLTRTACSTGCTWSEADQIVEIAAIQRQFHYLGVVDRSRHHAFCGLQQLGLRLNVDRFSNLADRQVEGEIDCAGNFELEVLLRLLLKARRRHFDAVRSGNKRNRGEVPAIVGRHFTSDASARIQNANLRA